MLDSPVVKKVSFTGAIEAGKKRLDELRAALYVSTPDDGMAAAEVIRQLAAGADAGLTGAAGPRYFAKVIGGSHPIGVAADWLTSMWGQNIGSYLASPANAVDSWATDGHKWLQTPYDCGY